MMRFPDMLYSDTITVIHIIEDPRPSAMKLPNRAQDESEIEKTTFMMMAKGEGNDAQCDKCSNSDKHSSVVNVYHA